MTTTHPRDLPTTSPQDADANATKMRAIVQTGYGDPHDVLEFRVVPEPEVGPDDVLVRLVATSVNTPDWAAVTGLPAILRLATGLRQPAAAVRGTDIAGIVEAVGSGVDAFEPGEEVYGSTAVGSLRRRNGTFAEFVAAPVGQLAPKPSSISFDEAAASVMSGLVALAALTETVDVGPGDRVLINGASGGVGTFAVQVAAARGAHVTTVSSERNLDLLRSLGADETIDYDATHLLDLDERFDVVLDNVMNHPPRRVARVLADGGAFLPNSLGSGSALFGGLPRMLRATLLGLGRADVRTTTLRVDPDRLAALTELLESGAVRPVIDSVHPLDRAADAIARMAARRASGNVVISMPTGRIREAGSEGPEHS